MGFCLGRRGVGCFRSTIRGCEWLLLLLIQRYFWLVLDVIIGPKGSAEDFVSYLIVDRISPCVKTFIFEGQNVCVLSRLRFRIYLGLGSAFVHRLMLGKGYLSDPPPRRS